MEEPEMKAKRIPNKPFVELTADEIKYLRKLPAVGHAVYNYSSSQIEKARRHLNDNIYKESRVNWAFAEKMLLLYEIYVRSPATNQSHVYDQDKQDKNNEIENRSRYGSGNLYNEL